MKRESILKSAATTLAIIGAGSILFNAMAETAMAAKAGQVETVPTSYQISNSFAATIPETNKESNEPVNYHVCMDTLNTGTPTDMDLSMEEAAEAGAQYLRNIFGLDMEGAYVYMMYSPGTVTFPRAFWSGDVLFEETQTPESTRWTYMVDAVTGELFVIGHSRNLDENPPLNYDKELAKDYGIYAELAKEKVEECNLLSGSIDRVEYNCQGYSGNDPDITMDVIGKKGEIVSIAFSRYDQTCLGIITDTSRRISESAWDDSVGEVETEIIDYMR